MHVFCLGFFCVDKQLTCFHQAEILDDASIFSSAAESTRGERTKTPLSGVQTVFCYRFCKTLPCSQVRSYYRLLCQPVSGLDFHEYGRRTVSQVNVLLAVWPECHPKAFKSRLREREDVRKEDTASYVWKKK